MTHYQKLATMIFRIIGSLFLVLSAISFVPVLFFWAFAVFDRYGKGASEGMAIFLFYTLPTAILGFIFFKLSRFLAKFVCYDFNEK